MAYRYAIAYPNKAFGLDADALAYIAAMEAVGGVFTDAQKGYINDMFADLKSEGLYSLIDAFYPFIGGTAATNKFNAKDPRDLDAAYRIVWGGGLTHNANGVTGDGVTGYGLTNYIIPVGKKNDFHLSVYVRNNTYTHCDIGAKQADNSRFTNIFSLSIGLAVSRINSLISTSFAHANSRGFWSANRSGATTENIYKSGVSVATSSNASVLPPENQIAVLARTITGTTVDNFSNHNLAFASIGSSLNAGQQLALYNIIQAFQTNFGRAV